LTPDGFFVKIQVFDDAIPNYTASVLSGGVEPVESFDAA